MHLRVLLIVLLPSFAWMAEARAGEADGGEPPATVVDADVARFDPAVLGRVVARVSEAAAALRGGRAEAALQLLASDRSDDAAWIRGTANVVLQRKAAAAKEFERLAAAGGPLASRASCAWAAALPPSAPERERLAASGGCVVDPLKGVLARLELARLHIEAKRPDDARSVLGDLPARPGKWRAEALHVRGLAEEAAGRRADALATHRLVFVEEATTPFAEKSRTRAKALVTALRAAPIEPRQLLDRVERLVAARRFAAAAADLKSVTAAPLCVEPACAPRPCGVQDAAAGSAAAPSCRVDAPAKPLDDVSCRAHMLRAAVARGTRAHPKAIEVGRLAYERCEAPEVRARALFIAAASAVATGHPDAGALAQVVALQFPSHALADDAWSLLAGVRRAAGDRVGERLALSMQLASQPDGDMAAESWFSLFWSWRAEGKPQEGLAALDRLASDFDAGPRGDGGDAERGRYWKGRTLLDLGGDEQAAEGRRILGALVTERPLTYYAVLARSLLAERGHPVPAGSPPAPSADPLQLASLATDAAFAQAVELVRLGLYRDAREVLLSLDTRRLRGEGRPGFEAVAIVGELLVRVGDVKAAHVVVRRELLPYLRTVGDPFLVRAARLAYPQAFRSHVLAATSPVGLDPDLLQGLMREESALDPRARSPVGARGLTQVMPPTGKQVAKTLKLTHFRVDDLWDPATNTRIGGWYLASMLKTFGHPGLAAAAYNAGPGNLRKWLRERPPEAFDAFAEEIPFSETRGYVRLVLRSWTSYRHLYGDELRGAPVVAIRLAGSP